MWCLRRSPSLRLLQGLKLGTFRAAGCVELGSLYTSTLDSSCVAVASYSSSSSPFQHPDTVSSKVLSSGIRKCSSQSYSSLSSSSEIDSDADDDNGDPFSELDGPAQDDESVSDADASDHDDDIEGPSQDTLGFSDSETDPSDKLLTRETLSSDELAEAIASSPSLSVEDVMNNWVEEGKDVVVSEVVAAMTILRKRRLLTKALQLSEWLEASKKLDFVERDYASRANLIAKVHGIQKAESYINSIPESFRGEAVYSRFLANCVATSDKKRAEQVFEKIKDSGFELTSFICNQMLILYKRFDNTKVADILVLMEEKNVKPTPFTYRLLIDLKGQSNDISGMEDIVALMKAEGLEPDLSTLVVMAKHYAYGGHLKEAEAIMDKIEEGELEKFDRSIHRFLLPLYAILEKADKVRRVWKVCESNPHLAECVAAIDAWGRLDRVDEAEAVFACMERKWGKALSSRQYSVLLKLYASKNLLEKGKDLVKKMTGKGFQVCPSSLNTVVQLFVEVGEVEKADLLLHKTVKQKKTNVSFKSCMAVLDGYSKRGDVHNSEKIYMKMKQCGFLVGRKQFRALVESYINAKLPAYGIRDRMRADNVLPSQFLVAQLEKVDAFRSKAVSDSP